MSLLISEKKDKLKYLQAVQRETNKKTLLEYKGMASLKKNDM